MAKGWLRGIFDRTPPPQGLPSTPQDIQAAFEHAVALHRAGRLEDAGAGYAGVLSIAPDHFDALHLAGLVRYQQGAHADAADLIAKAIALNPGQAAPHSNLGLALERLGRLQEAMASYDRAIEIEPAFVAAQFNRGNVLRDMNRLEEALSSYDRVIGLSPDHAEALNNRGLLLNDLQRSEEALLSFDRAIAARPSYAEALNNRGTTLSLLGRHADALANYDIVLATKPGYAAAHNNRGAALGALLRFDEALACYASALAIEPGFADAHYNQAVALSTLKKHAAALASFDRALELRTDYAEAANGRGTALRDLGRTLEALESYDRALMARPAFPEALDNRGVVLANLGRHQEALASHDRALALRPGFSAALSNRAAVLRETGKRHAAMDAYSKAIAAEPGALAIRFKRLISCVPVLAHDEAEIALSRSQFIQEAGFLEAWASSHEMKDEQQAVGAAQPFHLAYQEENNRELLERYGALCSRLMKNWQQRNHIQAGTQPPPSRPRLRIGIVSAHIHTHSVWNAIVKGWLQQLDRRRFEIEIFHLGNARDAETEFAIAQSDRFICGERRLDEWAAAISERKPDALIYPEVGMDITTPRLASMRLAPVQIAAWGHPETTGFPTIDYYLSADDFESSDSQAHYTEKLVPLPNLGCYYDPEDVADGTLDADSLRLEEGTHLFVCPGTPFKYAPQHDAVFARIARRVENAQFVFFTFAAVPALSRRLGERIGRAFTAEGLDSSKYIRFVPWQPKADFFALLRRADVFLDTIGFSGFNTAMQAIECGLPIVTREGRFMRGKFASAILRRMQLGELVCHDDQMYVDCAVRLAQDKQFNARIRKRILEAREILFRDSAPIRALEDFLTKLKP